MTDPQRTNLNSYTVEFRPAGSTESRYFHAMARNKEEAMRNTRRANPACTVVGATDANLQTHTETDHDEPWRPSVEPDTYPSIEEIVGQAVGTGSMCWHETPAGIFDSTKAQWVVEGASAAIKRTINLDRPFSLDAGPLEVFDGTDYEKLRMQDQLYVIRRLTEDQPPLGSDLANFRRRLQLILGEQA